MERKSMKGSANKEGETKEFGLCSVDSWLVGKSGWRIKRIEGQWGKKRDGTTLSKNR